MFLDWSPDDQAAALNWMIEQRGRCRACGTSEWQHPDEGHGSTFEVDAYVCFGCEQLDRERERRKDQTPQHGLKLGFFPREHVDDGS